MSTLEMADYELRIKADSGYESTSSGRCNSEQFSLAYGTLIGTVDPDIERQHAVMLEALTLALPALEAMRQQWPRSPHDDSVDVVELCRSAIAAAT